ncbi:MAG: RNA polymerase sigma factor [Ruminococcaceae bacterium]|nr:RNA polymerase sigma factor [Oscillospiraceae bacterium]
MTDREKIFNQIYDKTYRGALIYVTAKCSHVQDIEDIMQEIYTELYSVITRKGGEYIAFPEAFVLKIAKRKVYLHYTLKERIRGVSLNSEDVYEREMIDSIPDDFDIEDDICTKDMLDEIGRYILSRSEITAKIFMLYYLLDLKISEIAEQLSVSESYVKNKLYRTIKELKARYGGDYK